MVNSHAVSARDRGLEDFYRHWRHCLPFTNWTTYLYEGEHLAGATLVGWDQLYPGRRLTWLSASLSS